MKAPRRKKWIRLVRSSGGSRRRGGRYAAVTVEQTQHEECVCTGDVWAPSWGQVKGVWTRDDGENRGEEDEDDDDEKTKRIRGRGRRQSSAFVQVASRNC